jgi:hypothetical protein
MSLHGGFAIPHHRLLVVYGYAFAFLIHTAELVLREDIPLLAFLFQCRDVDRLALSQLHGADSDQHEIENRVLGGNLRNLTPLDSVAIKTDHQTAANSSPANAFNFNSFPSAASIGWLKSFILL